MPAILLSAAVVLSVILTGCDWSAGSAYHDATAVETDASGQDHDASASEKPVDGTPSEKRRGTAEALDTDTISPPWNGQRLVDLVLEVLWEIVVIVYQEYLFETYVTVLQQSGWFPDSPLTQITLVVVPFVLCLFVVQYWSQRRKKSSVHFEPQFQPSRSSSRDSISSCSATIVGSDAEDSTGDDESGCCSQTGAPARQRASVGTTASTSSANQQSSQEHKWAEEVDYIGAVIGTGIENCDVTCDVNGISLLGLPSSDDDDLRLPNSAARAASPLSPAVRGSARRGLRCSAAPMVTARHRLAQMSFRLDNVAD